MKPEQRNSSITPLKEMSRQDIVRRFRKLNELRLERLQMALQPRQQLFLELLALLFHQNLPTLPGFVDEMTPFGIAQFKPSAQAVLMAKTVTKDNAYKVEWPRSFPIEAIFLLSNLSGVAFAKNTDIIVWICHESTLSEISCAFLQRKAVQIEQWALSIGVVARCCLVDRIAFLQGKAMPLAPEHNNSGHPHLLREAFYRSSIHLAGKIPAWWFVPPHQDIHYTAYVDSLYAQQLIQPEEVIDFGGLENVPAEEIVSGLLEGFYKVLYAPYRGLPELALMESYAAEYPRPNWLCGQLKRAIYDYSHDVDLNELDSTLLAYAKLDDFYQGRLMHLQLLRHCFYVALINPPAINLSVSDNLKSGVSTAVRTGIIQKIATYWQWPAAFLPDLMNDKLWHIGRVNGDFEDFQAYLQHSFVAIKEFMQQSNPQNGLEDFQLIGAQLGAFLKPKRGKVDIISTQRRVQVLEDEVSLVESVAPDGLPEWLLFSGKVNRQTCKEFAPMKRMRSYFAALVWIVINGVYHKRIVINADTSSVNLVPLERNRICRHIQELLRDHADAIMRHLENYRTVNAGLVTLAFINLFNTEIKVRQDSKLMLSPQSDALSYGANHDCLVQRIDSVMVSQWGEVKFNRYVGAAGLFEYLIDSLNALDKPLQPKQLEIICNTPLWGNVIQHRLHNLFKQLCHIFAAVPPEQTLRYFLVAGSSYYCIQYQSSVFSYWAIPSKAQIFSELGAAQLYFGQAAFDAEMNLKSIVPALYTFNQPNKIQLFCVNADGHCMVYGLDEKGSLFKQQHAAQKTECVLNSYAVFLENMQAHYFKKQQYPVEYYEIAQVPGKGLTCRAMNLGPMSFAKKMVIHISAELDEKNTAEYWIYCNGRSFSTPIQGKAALGDAADHIAQWRQEHPQDPIYVSAVKVPLAVLGVEDGARLQSIHFLNIKQKMETRLQM